MNLSVMKCYKKLFCKSGILYNIGSYILLSTMMIYFITIILFLLKESTILKNKIENINHINNKIKNEDRNKKSDKNKVNIREGKNSFKKKKERKK